MTVVDHPASRDQPANLADALEAVREALILHARLDPEEARSEAPASHPIPPAADAPSRLEALCRFFDLDPFERDVVVLCAGIELDATFMPLCAKAQVDPDRAYPTFGLALAALPGAHWQAVLPEAPLRYWQLIRPPAGEALTHGELRIDERILHFLMGFDSRDDRLLGWVEPVAAGAELVPSHRRLAEYIADTWRRTRGSTDFPVVELCGTDAADRRAVAVAGAAAVGLRLEAMLAETLPTGADELDQLLRVWHREALLSGAALLLESDDLPPEDPRQAALKRFVDLSRGAVVVGRRQRLGSSRRALLSLDIDKPEAGEQRDLWLRVANGSGRGTALDEKHIETLVAHFHMSGAEIRGAWLEALGKVNDGGETPTETPAETPAETAAGEVSSAVWRTCRQRVRPALAGLVERIVPRARWDDLVLPEEQLEILREIVLHMRHRATVYRHWGFAGKSARGLGMSALFAGSSGTGKTMAAELLADKLDLDLYCIDLSSVINKYIGETEKNLQRVFDAAESGGAILLFDEADALFGKRSEVKDSHDRYANIGVSYLLQRMETYRGLAILTTNMIHALDPAFKRRLRFIVEFPFPGPEERCQIWQRVFPRETPTEALDPERLARVNLSGGNIRNIAMNAAFLAADAGLPVTMGHMLSATRRELMKLNRPLPMAETQDWTS